MDVEPQDDIPQMDDIMLSLFERVGETVTDMIDNFLNVGEDPPFIQEYERVMGCIVDVVRSILNCSFLYDGETAYLSVNDVMFTHRNLMTNPVVVKKKGQTYGTDIRVTLCLSYKGITDTASHVICTVPVMIGSKYCVLSAKEEVDLTKPETFHDQIPRGMFIINGVLCHLLPEFKARNGDNRVLVRMRATGGKRSRPKYYNATHMRADVHRKYVTILNTIVQTIEPKLTFLLRIPSSKYVVPLGLIFKALGYTIDSLRAECNLIGSDDQYNDVWSSPSLECLYDQEMTPAEACTKIQEMVEEFMYAAVADRALKGIEYILWLVFPQLSASDHILSASSVMRKKMAFLFLFQYMIIAITTNSRIVDAPLGPISYSFHPFVDAVASAVRRYLNTLRFAHTKVGARKNASSKVGLWNIFKRVPDAFSNSACINSTISIPAQAQVTKQKNTGRRTTQSIGASLDPNVSKDLAKHVAYTITTHSPPLRDGSICPFTGPKSLDAEKRRRLASGVFLSKGCDVAHIYNALEFLLSESGYTAVTVDGVCVGYYDADPKEIVDFLEECRAEEGSPMSDITACHVHDTNIVHVFACPGRLCFFVFNLATLRKTDPAWVLSIIDGKSNRDAIQLLLTKRILDVSCDGCTTQYGVKTGLDKHVLSSGHIKYSYPALRLVMCRLARDANPMVSLQQAVRTAHSSAMYVQAFQQEPSNSMHTGTLMSAQTSLMRQPEGASPNTTQLLVLFCATDATNEDAVQLNRRTFEQGALNVTRRITIRHERVANPMSPDFANALACFREYEEYASLDDSGVVKVGTIVKYSSVLVFDVLIKKTGKDIKYDEQSARNKAHYEARVDKTYTEKNIVYVELIHTIQGVGSKITNMSVKGVVTTTVDVEDMPFDNNGNVADAVFTYSNISRGTIAPSAQGMINMARCMFPDDERVSNPPNESKISEFARYCYELLESSSARLCGGCRRKGCVRKCESYFMLGQTGAYIGRLSPDGKVFQPARVRMVPIDAIVLCHVASSKAFYADGVMKTMHYGYMEQHASMYSLSESTISGNTKPIGVCNECSAECERGTDMRFRCPFGHSSDSVRIYNYSTSLSTLSRNLAYAAGIALVPAKKT
jgi:hypothetical protein